MRISSSSIYMAATRNYAAEAVENAATITRGYEGGQAVSARVSTTTAKISQFEVEGTAALFTTTADGMTREDAHRLEHAHSESRPAQGGARIVAPRMVSFPKTNWLSGFNPAAESPQLNMLMRILELLERFSGKKSSLDGGRRLAQRDSTAAAGWRFSASQASLRYRETVAMLSGGSGGVGEANAAVTGLAVSSGQSVNGHWTQQTVRSGFVEGQENTAFCSKGTVVTTDGRTIDFNISVEMSRSFESAYVSVGKEEVFTDPLVINLNTDAARLSDVSFYFDLNCDGTEEELSALDSSSGFLALDKNGDGEINDGSELFGAKTGDGFGELAQYDQDGNGWIDEGDDVFSRLKVWVKCGEGEAELLSLDQADVGAIFLGNQDTQHSLTDSYGQTGAMIRKTGLYLKESGSVGTVQHVDFKG